MLLNGWALKLKSYLNVNVQEKKDKVIKFLSYALDINFVSDSFVDMAILTFMRLASMMSFVFVLFLGPVQLCQHNHSAPG